MVDLSSWSLTANAAVFLGAAGLIAWSGVKLAGLADKIADRTGLGEAVTGTVFLGFTTALPGLAASITAALDGHPALAISNAIGGIAIQTSFLAVSDLAYRRANLEHAAASVVNMVQTACLVFMLTVVLLGLTGPEMSVAHVHPITVVLLLVAGAGFWLVYQTRTQPMWRPRRTTETVEDIPDQSHMSENLTALLVEFGVSAVLVIVAGAVVAHTSGNVAEQTGISETLAGGLFSGGATSLPELVTSVAAVRRGALTLAVSDIVGGNFFDVLFVFAADVVYLNGSLYHATGVGARETFLTGIAILMNVTLLLGLLYRQRTGPANIGFESVTMLTLYIGGFLVVSFLM